jgi:hypothetical protein
MPSRLINKTLRFDADEHRHFRSNDPHFRFILSGSQTNKFRAANFGTFPSIVLYFTQVKYFRIAWDLAYLLLDVRVA